MLRVHTRLMVGALAAASLLGFSACGGGGGGGTPSGGGGGGGGGNAPPVQADLLVGSGSFDSADAWNWWDAAGARPTPGITDCADFGGKCFQITSSNYGADVFSAQLAYWSKATDKIQTLSLQAAKQYRIAFRGKESGATSDAAASIELWLQNAADTSKIHAYKVKLTDAVASYQSDPITVAADETVTFTANFGTQADHQGVTFSLDDLQVLEEDQGGNALVTKATFDTDDTAVWNHWGSATFALASCASDGFSGNCLKVSGASFGSDPWSSQLVYCGGSGGSGKLLSFAAGKTYTVKLKAKSSKAMTLSVWLQDASDDPVPDGLAREVALDGTLQSISWDFTVSSASQLKLKLNFGYAANAGGTIQLDDIELVSN